MTGTTVRFLPDLALSSGAQIPLAELHLLARAFGPYLAVEITRA